MTREEFYKLTDILNSEVLGNFMHGGEADELIAMFEETVEQSNVLEQEKPISEELEEAVHEYMQHIPESEPELMDSFYTWEQMEAAFKAGANWQFNQFEKNRLAACDRATDEEIKREQNFVDKIIIGEHRQPTYSDAIEYGIKWQKEQMMSQAIDGLVICDKELTQGYKDIVFSMPKELKVDDKVKMIIVKED